MSVKNLKKYKLDKLDHLYENLGQTLNIPNNEEYEYLEKVVLGTGNEIFQQVPSDVDSDDSDYEKTPSKKAKKDVSNEKQPAWVDEEDNVTLNEVLKEQERKEKQHAGGSKIYQNAMEKTFKELMGVPKWAELKNSKKVEPVDEILNQCGEFVQKPKILNKTFIKINPMKSLNSETGTEGPVISVVKFHPKSTIAMIAGSSGIVSLFQVDGKINSKLESLQFQKFPIFCGSFLNNGEEFIVGSKFYNFFFCHNMITGRSIKINESKITEMTKMTTLCVSPRDDLFAICGKGGKIHLFTVKSKEYVDSLQMNNKVNAICFNGDGSLLYSHGGEGEVYVWNMNTRTCINKFVDDGCLTGSAIAASYNNQFVACGSNSGVVNIYGSDVVDPGARKLPIKTFYNLTTTITNIQFNSSSEILAIASGHKKANVKLINCASMTVFPNFPSFQCKVKKPISMDFSKNSGYFAVGDSEGVAHLFRLKHYGNY